MTIKRLVVLTVLLLVGLGSVFLLPKGVALQPAGIDLSLPEFVGTWYGTDQAITQGERDSLGPDTGVRAQALHERSRRSAVCVRSFCPVRT
jgi:hypothetical protein